MSSNNRRSPLVGIIVILVIIGLIATYSSLFNSSNTNSKNTVNQTNQPQTISYKGEDKIDALTLLKKNYTAETQTSGSLGEYVTSIGGVKAGANRYWAFYVNGQLSDTGAAQKITSSTDTIEWKIESY